MLERRRPLPRPHLPIPAVRGLDPSPPQARRPDQLGTVARSAADDRRRSSPRRPSWATSPTFRVAGTAHSTISATSACSPESCCSRSASCDRACRSVPGLLPMLFFLHGDFYRACFVVFMIAGVMTLLVRLRRTPPSAARQQIKWALFGFSGYSLFLSLRSRLRHDQADGRLFGASCCSRSSPA